MKKTASILFLFLTVFLLFSCQTKESSLSLVKGKNENNVYINEYLNLKFAPGPNWYFSDSLAEDDEKTSTELYAIETRSGEYVQICIEDLSMSFGGTLCEEADYLEIISEQLEAAETSSYTVNGTRKVTVAGREFTEMSVSESDSEGVAYRYLVERFDDYMLTITVSDYTDIEAQTSDYIGNDTILSMFSELS